MPVATMTGRMAASESAAIPSGSGTSVTVGRRGRRPTSVSFRAKLERSRQSARECRARKKLRYQYLEELVASREKAIFALRDELKMFKEWCVTVDSGQIPPKLVACLAQHRQRIQCTSTSSVDSLGDMMAESKESKPPIVVVPLHSPTVTSSLGSPHQHRQPSTTVTNNELETSGTLKEVKLEPVDIRWESPIGDIDTRVGKSTVTTAANVSVGSGTLPQQSEYMKSFLNQPVPDQSFDMTDETLSLIDVFDFDN